MARTLTIKNTEEPATSRLFNVFLLVALGWLVLGMVFAGVSAGDAGATEATPVIDIE
ncbi:MAG TPA: hypothetical protein QGF58_23350 [Myxococcota bacterium]|nr:hypothetical protein [Myxococcota bacterium]